MTKAMDQSQNDPRDVENDMLGMDLIMLSTLERKMEGIFISDVGMRTTKPQMLLILILEQEHLITSGW